MHRSSAGSVNSMTHSIWLSPTAIYLLLIGLSGLLGALVPEFYQWTGSDQSRMSPIVGWVAAGMAIVAAAIWSGLPFVTLRTEASASGLIRPIRFQLRTLFLWTTALAIGFAGLIRFPMPVSVFVCVAAYLHLAWFIARQQQHRWAAAALIGCMTLPYVWIAAPDGTNGIDVGWILLWMAGGMPMLFPAGFAASWLGQSLNDVGWLAIVMTAAQLVLGTWIIRLGPKRTIAYLIGCLLVSTFGSFCLHAMVLA
ncbi:hypothetical protein CA51_22110 [Rosistilla oblonga]|nr:hypothetical protein CA51_22110 [Rosistilla oblonga]